MPPRYAYWTILVDGQPTAFRAAEVDELLPTLKRLQVKQPTAVMKWFQRGRLWDSHDEAREKLAEGYTVNPDGSLAPPSEEHRAKGWRPGGEHRDPREKYQLAKKAKWQKFKQMVRSRPGHGPKADDTVPPADDQPVLAPPATDWRGRPVDSDTPAPAARPRAPRPEWRDKPAGSRGPKPEWRDRGPAARGPKPEWRDKPAGPRGPRPEWRDKPAGPRGPKPQWGDKPAGPRGPKPEWRDRGPAARGPKPEWRDKPAGPRGPRPEWRDKPAGPRGPKPEWGDKPAGPRGPKPEWRDRGPSAPRSGPKKPWGGKPAAGGRFAPRGGARGPGGPRKKKE
jgi:hypothetical protein